MQEDAGCITHGGIFRNTNGNPAGIPVVPSGIGIRYKCQVSGPGSQVPGTR
jgi:hypothetical protein